MVKSNVCSTVVGGRAPRSEDIRVVPLSGIEQALKLAAGDRRFRADLFQRRSEAIIEAGICIDPSDAATIDVVPENQLESLVKAIVTRYKRNTVTTRFGL